MAFAVPASAAERLHGTILATTPANDQIIVRHDAFSGMPSMTMAFRVVPRGAARTLPANVAIDADVDRSTEPWTLSHVRVVTATAPAPLTLRRVPPAHLGDTIAEIPGAVDQNGRPFRFAALRGRDVIVAFVYTRCQDARMCPLISAKFRQLQAALGTRAAHLVEITLDPAFDTPPVLKRYAALFGADPARWSLVTGPPDAVLDETARFGIGAFQPRPGLVIHAENTVLIDRDGRIRDEITETSWTPDQLVASIDADNGRGANPVARFALWLSKNAAAVCGNATGSFNGLTDLIVTLAIVGALAFVVFRLARGMFADTKS